MRIPCLPRGPLPLKQADCAEAQRARPACPKGKLPSPPPRIRLQNLAHSEENREPLVLAPFKGAPIPVGVTAIGHPYSERIPARQIARDEALRAEPLPSPRQAAFNVKGLVEELTADFPDDRPGPVRDTPLAAEIRVLPKGTDEWVESPAHPRNSKRMECIKTLLFPARAKSVLERVPDMQGATNRSRAVNRSTEATRFSPSSAKASPMRSPADSPKRCSMVRIGCSSLTLNASRERSITKRLNRASSSSVSMSSLTPPSPIKL